MDPKKTVLLVEDEADLLWLARYALQKQGLQVITAGSSAEAVEALNGQHPDLVVLDVSLPDAEGTSVCQYIRKQSALRNIPVMLFTAMEMSRAAEKAEASGADSYLTKPYDSDRLVAAVNDLLLERHYLPGRSICAYSTLH